VIPVSEAERKRDASSVMERQFEREIEREKERNSERREEGSAEWGVATC